MPKKLTNKQRLMISAFNTEVQCQAMRVCEDPKAVCKVFEQAADAAEQLAEGARKTCNVISKDFGY